MVNAKLTSLQEKRRALNARIQKEQAKQQSAQRRIETRRKILAGAVVLERARTDADYHKRLLAELGTFLTKDRDRALFGFGPVEGKKE